MQGLRGGLPRAPGPAKTNVAALFAISAIPMLGLSGAAIDYAQASRNMARAQIVADSIALSLVHDAGTATLSELQARAETQLPALLAQNPGLSSQVSVQKVGRDLKVTASLIFPTSFMKVLQQDTLTVTANSTATFGTPAIEIALVLDNTGSMGSMGKMAALKSAANDLIDKLKAMNAEAGRIKVSVVPFNTQIRVSASNVGATWLRWGVKLENPSIGSAANAPAPATWTGCISDRDQVYDANGAAPIGGNSNYVAANCQSSSLAETVPLTTDLETARTTVNSMTPTGATNITIGLATGLATLRADSPFGNTASTDSSVKKFVILLTDGNNTMNRWGGNGSEGNGYVSQIDSRLQESCANARTQRIQVFTVRVIAGNEPLLRGCATTPDMYYPATTAADIAPAFARILQQITAPRLTM